MDFIKINLICCCVDDHSTSITEYILNLKIIIFWDVTPCSPVEVLLFSRLPHLSTRSFKTIPITLLLDPTAHVWDPYKPTSKHSSSTRQLNLFGARFPLVACLNYYYYSNSKTEPVFSSETSVNVCRATWLFSHRREKFI
jgi:hypothetical protein